MFLDSITGLSQQDEVRQISDERDRPVGHSSLLRQHRSRQLHLGLATHRGQTDCSVLQNHEDSQVRTINN